MSGGHCALGGFPDGANAPPWDERLRAEAHRDAAALAVAGWGIDDVTTLVCDAVVDRVRVALTDGMIAGLEEARR